MNGVEPLIALCEPLELVATGFEFTEGPIWHPDEGALYFSDIPGNTRRRWHPAEGVSIVREPSNMCNGMTLANDGSVIVCEHATSSVVCEGPGGRSSTIASHWLGRELNSPNDVIVARDGSVIFTDPTYGRIPYFGIERKPELDFCGVYRVTPAGDSLELLVDDCVQPNGVCLSPSEDLLYVNDTKKAHIRVFDVLPDWSLGNGRIFAGEITADPNGGDGFVDGMKLDELGNLYVTGPGGIWIYSPEGVRLVVLEVPEKVGNLNWGDSDWKTLYITASTSIYRMRMPVAGNRLGYMA